jgi:dihydrolipoamide dehydrogenase
VSQQVTVPDIGDFTDVPIIEILVAPGQEVAAEEPLVVLESDKATLEIPAPSAGTVGEILVKVGDTVSQGTPIITLQAAAAPDESPPSEPRPVMKGSDPDLTDDSAVTKASDPNVTDAHVVVIGGGPGGYTAAFRAADLGLKVTLVERYETLGGVCLNVGCIPSKALLHIARVIAEARDSAAHGLTFGDPEIDLDKVREFKDSVVKRLTGGLKQLAKRRKVEVVTGVATFTGPNAVEVDGREIAFSHCIIAAGSTAARLPFVPDDRRVMDSTDALDLENVPERLLVIGGGIIGLEMATVYDALGSQVTVVELLDQLIPGADADLIRPLEKRIKGRYEAIYLKASVTAVEAADAGLEVTFAGGPEPATFDRVLVAVGRKPNGRAVGAENAGVNVDERGFIAVDEQLRTNVPHIFAIGDVVGEPMLAHKATHEAKVAAEVIAGHDVTFDARSIPSVAYTDPEVAWTGLTETQAKADGTPYEAHKFPWAASGRALGIGRPEGVTKMLVEPGTKRVLGAGIVGVNAGELIAEVAHAIEMGAVADDIGLTIHPHPTLTETVAFAAEAAAGTLTDL